MAKRKKQVRSGKYDTPKEERPEEVWREHKKAAFLVAFKKLRGIVTAAASVGVSHNTIWKWRRDDPAFADRFNALEEMDTEQLEREARRRAMKSSDVLTMFLLNGRRPEKYRQNVKMEHAGEVKVSLVKYGEEPKRPKAEQEPPKPQQ